MDMFEDLPDAYAHPDYKQAAAELRSKHDCWWNTWVPPRLNLEPATLRIQVGGVGHAFYNNKDDVIRLFMTDGDIEELTEKASLAAQSMPYFSRKRQWACITAQLLHEMMHEYEHKVLKCTSTREGEAMFGRCSPSRFGPGHEGPFYSAIAINAVQFDMSPSEFEAEL